MKNLIFLLSALVLFSGCATDRGLSKINFGENSSILKGGTVTFYGKLNYSNLTKETLSEDVLSQIYEVCPNQNFKIKSWEKEITSGGGIIVFLVVIIPFDGERNKIEFECLK